MLVLVDIAGKVGTAGLRRGATQGLIVCLYSTVLEATKEIDETTGIEQGGLDTNGVNRQSPFL